MFRETKFNVIKNNGYRYILRNEEADGPETLVLLHGMFGGLSNFDGLLQQVTRIKMVVPEIPIYSLDRKQLDIPYLTGWLDDFLDTNEIERPVLLGNSMGGHVALDYAVTHPEKLEALVLTGSSGLFENNLGSSKPKRYDRSYIKERASLTFYEDLVDDKMIDEILEVLQSKSKLSRLLRIARSTHEYNLEDRLKEIEHPTLLIWGRNDVITPPEVAETFHEKIPNSTLEWIDRCGHAPMMERPARFANHLIDFLQSQGFITQNKKDINRHEEDYSHI